MQKILALLKPVFRKKTTIFTFILIGIAMSLTIVLKTYYDTSYNGYYGEIRENAYQNTYWVTRANDKKISGKEFRNQMRKELDEIEHVVGVYHNSNWANGGLIEKFKKNEKVDGRITLQPATNESLPEIVMGSNFPEDNDAHYMICPKNFIPAGGYLERFSRFDMVNLKKYLNKNITLKYENHATNEDLEISLKLVGIYKNSVSDTDENVCYVKETTINSMNLAQRGLSEIDYSGDADGTAFYVQVDRYKNKELVKEKLEKLGYNVEEITFIAYEDFEKIASNIALMNKILNSVIFVLIFLILIKQFFDNNKYYNLLNILGYTKTKICLINIVSNLILIIFSMIITLVLAVFMENILNIVVYFKPFIFSKFEIIMNYSSLSYILPLAFIPALVVSGLGCLKLGTDKAKIK